VSDEEDPLSFRRRLEKASEMDLSAVASVERDDSSGWIEPDECASTIILDDVKGTIKVQGYDLEEPPKPAPDAERKALAKADPTSDYKRNRTGYKVMCPSCLGSGKCPDCRGRGRVRIFFKCKRCLGTGRCTDCDREGQVRCPQCQEWMSQYSDVCLRCGLSVRCPICGSPMPIMGTRCLSCKEEFICKGCSKPFPIAHSHRCPRCSAWNGRV